MPRFLRRTVLSLVAAACGGVPAGPAPVTLDAPTLTGTWQALLPAAGGAPDTMRLVLVADAAPGGGVMVAGTALHVVLGLPLEAAVSGTAAGSRATLTLTASGGGFYPAGAGPVPDELALDGVRRGGRVTLDGRLVSGPFATAVRLTRVAP